MHVDYNERTIPTQFSVNFHVKNEDFPRSLPLAMTLSTSASHRWNCIRNSSDNTDASYSTITEKHPHSRTNVLRTLGELKANLRSTSRTQYNPFHVFPRCIVTRGKTNGVIIDNFDVPRKSTLSHI
mmetsp:Transcript_11118/g.23384  ORF Transcript_11118/g.23384 Transcript_11118/m.23384 type:complete len:126 (+) Transcript_11118:48-425(+)